MKTIRFAIPVLAASVLAGCTDDRLADDPSSPAVEVVTQEVTESANLIINASFGSTTDSFTYADDQFRGTTQPSYASGNRVTSGGISGGTLRVLLGGVNNNTITGMSGGWSRTFTLAAPARISVSFRFRVTQTANYEADEVSQALVSIDGSLRGVPPADWQAQIAGNGDGGSEITTGIKTANADFGVLPAGSHKLTLGGFNSKKNNTNESTQIWIDDVKVTSLAAAPLLPLCDAQHCCPAGTTPVILTEGSDNRSFTQTNRCIVALGGHDAVTTSGTGTTVLGGAGDDQLTGVANSRVRGGEGNDTINVSGGAVAIGGPGNDTIMAGNGDNFVYPGPGQDVVAGGTGNDTVVIYDVCELTGGKNLDGSSGTNTLVTPVPVATLQAMGVAVSNFQNIVVQGNSCRSDCSTKPDCMGHGSCQEGASPGQTFCKCDPGFLPPNCTPACPPGSGKVEPGQCGCSIPDTDTDGDGTADCVDQCRTDASKTTPGLCGCGAAETDSDNDGVPNCIDGCPLDPKKVRPGHCGCSNAAEPIGTVCADGICGVASTCNDSGACGDAQACSPDPNKCTEREFDGNKYWFCPGPLTRDAAAAKCRAVPGGWSMVQIDSRRENLFVANVIGGTTWLGATDKALEGSWRWSNSAGDSGDTFWSGGASGSRVGNLFEKWAKGSPAGGAAANCAVIQAGGATTRGTWIDSSCTVTLPFVCEKPIDALAPITPPPADCSTFTPGATCTPAPPESPTCVSGDSLFPMGEAAARAQVAACKACETDPDPMGCAATACVGAAEPPPPGNTCPPFTLDEQRQCELLLIPGQTVLACNTDADCAVPGRSPGQVCGVHYPDPSCSVCDEVIAGKCTKDCGAVRKLCGRFAPECGRNQTKDRCAVVEVCTRPEEKGSDTLDPISDVTPTLVDPELLFPVPPPPATTFPPDPPCASEPCNAGQNHNWCKYQVESVLPDRNAAESKEGSAGRGSKVSFVFDPQLTLDYKGNPLPFGESEFEFSAKAGLTAGVKFDLPPPLDGQLDIIDAVAEVNGNRCQATTARSRLKVLNGEFLPMDLKFDTHPTLVNKDDCDKAIKKFQEQVSRAKKAYKDAQEIIRQFKDLKARSATFTDDFCATLTAAAPADFPGGNCVPGEVQQTINRFVEYYNQKVEKLHQFQAELGSKVLAFEKNIDILKGNAKSEERRLFQAQFFIGPVPALLQVNGFLNYGIKGSVHLEAHPGVIVNLSNEKEPIAWFDAEAQPFASAGVSLFVGAGFSFLGVSASAGIEGRLNLGTLSAPLRAGTGLAIQPVDDDRPVPIDIASISDGLTKFPGLKSKKYEFALRYGYGASIKANQILEGKLGIRITIEFLFFSKTWRKTFLDYKGINLGEIKLITGDGSHTALGFRAWGVSQMPMPFMGIKPVTDTPAPPPDGGAPGDASMPPATKEPFSFAKVEKVFFDRLCTCQPAGQACATKDDCCDVPGQVKECINDLSGPGRVCGTCKAVPEVCEEHEDCCSRRCHKNPGEAQGTCQPVIL